MPPAFGLHPFARVIEASRSYRAKGVRPVVPDPGGPLADWESLPWSDAHSGEGIKVTTDPTRVDDALLETLRVRSVA